MRIHDYNLRYKEEIQFKKFKEQKLNNKQTSLFSRYVFKTIRFLVRLFYGKTTIVGIENLPQKNTIIVGNHTQMNGPIIGELFLPNNCFTWCAGEMMALKEVPAYAYKDFWSQKPRWTLPYYKILSYIIQLPTLILNQKC